MAPVAQYVFAEMRRKSEHFTAGRHECLPYSKNVECSEIYKHQFIDLRMGNRRQADGDSGIMRG